jgi:hypothetical protein
MVILVPGKVISYNEQEGKIDRHWFQLREIFSNSDQCLELEDPLQPILDRIHGSATGDPDSSYLLRRLPIHVGSGDAAARELLNRSFAAFRARKRGHPEWIEQRVDSAIRQRHAIGAMPAAVEWFDELATTTGVLSGEQVLVLGYDLALQHVLERLTPRVAVHRRFAAIESRLRSGHANEAFADAVRRVQRANNPDGV